MRRTLIMLLTVPAILSANAIQDKGTAQEPPAIIKKVDPVYPKPIPKDSAEGTVYVKLIVDAQGDVAEASVIKSQVGEIFQKAVLDAARQWKFAPAEKGQKREKVELVLPFKFKLSDEKKEKQ